MPGDPPSVTPSNSGEPAGKAEATVIGRGLQWWVNRPYLDWVMAGLSVVGVYAARSLLDWHVLAGIDAAGRLTWLQTLTGVTGLVVGVGVTAGTVIFAVTPSTRLRFVLETVGERLVRLIMWSIAMLACSTALFALAMPFASVRESHGIGPFVGFWIVLGGLSGVRLLWLFRALALVLVAGVVIDLEAEPEAPPSGPWHKPLIDESDYPRKQRNIPKRRKAG